MEIDDFDSDNLSEDIKDTIRYIINGLDTKQQVEMLLYIASYIDRKW